MSAIAERERIVAERYRMSCVECRSLGARRKTLAAAQADAARHNRKRHPEVQEAKS